MYVFPWNLYWHPLIRTPAVVDVGPFLSLEVFIGQTGCPSQTCLKPELSCHRNVCPAIHLLLLPKEHCCFSTSGRSSGWTAGSLWPAAETEASALLWRFYLLCSLWQIAWVRPCLWHWLSTNTKSNKMWREVWALEIIKWMMYCMFAFWECRNGLQVRLIDLRETTAFSFVLVIVSDRHFAQSKPFPPRQRNLFISFFTLSKSIISAHLRVQRLLSVKGNICLT